MLNIRSDPCAGRKPLELLLPTVPSPGAERTTLAVRSMETRDVYLLLRYLGCFIHLPPTIYLPSYLASYFADLGTALTKTLAIV